MTRDGIEFDDEHEERTPMRVVDIVMVLLAFVHMASGRALDAMAKRRDNSGGRPS